MIFEGTIIPSAYNPYSVYFRIAAGSFSGVLPWHTNHAPSYSKQSQIKAARLLLQYIGGPRYAGVLSTLRRAHRKSPGEVSDYLQPFVVQKPWVLYSWVLGP